MANFAGAMASTFRLKDLDILGSKADLALLPKGKLLINTINAHSYNMARRNPLFAEALMQGDVVLPDGISIVKACRWIGAKSQPRERVAGWDLFSFEMDRLNEQGRREGRTYKVMFVGSTERVLSLIRARVKAQYPFLECVTLSPPYRKEFSAEESKAMVESVNRANPDLLWIGMTAPKQEKWAYSHWAELEVHCHVGTVGAVFDFFAGTVERAPETWRSQGLEWLYRFLREPRRMWRRYLLGNVRFLYNIIVMEKLAGTKKEGM